VQIHGMTIGICNASFKIYFNIFLDVNPSSISMCRERCMHMNI